MISEFGALPVEDLVSQILITARPLNRLRGRTLMGGMVDAAAAVSSHVSDTVVEARPAGPGAVRLSWSGPSFPYFYRIERSPNGVDGWVPVATSGRTNVLVNTGLAPNTTYYYRMRFGVNVLTNVTQTTTSSEVPAATGTFHPFDGAALSSVWSPLNGTWSQSGGVVRQTATRNDPDHKLRLTRAGSFTGDVEIVAKVRIDSWINGEASYARAGIGLNGRADGQGYSLVFRTAHGERPRVQFLNDGVTWGNPYAFNWQVGTWYWLKLKSEDGILYGKVWADGTPEPTNYQLTQRGWTTLGNSGTPYLNGGSASPLAGFGTASFDEVSVTVLSPGTPGAILPPNSPGVPLAPPETTVPPGGVMPPSDTYPGQPGHPTFPIRPPYPGASMFPMMAPLIAGLDAPLILGMTVPGGPLHDSEPAPGSPARGLWL